MSRSRSPRSSFSWLESITGLFSTECAKKRLGASSAATASPGAAGNSRPLVG